MWFLYKLKKVSPEWELLDRRTMKVTVSFNTIKIVVPCGDGELTVRELTQLATTRFVRIKYIISSREIYYTTVKRMETFPSYYSYLHLNMVTFSLNGLWGITIQMLDNILHFFTLVLWIYLKSVGSIFFVKLLTLISDADSPK